MMNPVYVVLELWILQWGVTIMLLRCREVRARVQQTRKTGRAQFQGCLEIAGDYGPIKIPVVPWRDKKGDADARFAEHPALPAKGGPTRGYPRCSLASRFPRRVSYSVKQRFVGKTQRQGAPQNGPVSEIPWSHPASPCLFVLVELVFRRLKRPILRGAVTCRRPSS